MNIRRDMWLKGFLVLLCCSSLVRTQERFFGASDIFLAGLGNIASFSVGSLLGFILKPCPDCPDETSTQPTSVMGCPDGFTPVGVEGLNTCYKYIAEIVNIEAAMLRCRDLAPRDGHVLALETSEELSNVYQFFDDLEIGGDYPSVWISAFNYDKDARFIWKTGTLVEGLNDIDDSVCAYFNLNARSFFPVTCALQGTFICETSYLQQP